MNKANFYKLILVVLLISLIPNIVITFQSLLNHTILLENKTFEVSHESIIVSFLLYISLLLLLLMISMFFIQKMRVSYQLNNKVSFRLGLFILILQCLFVIFNYIYQINTAGYNSKGLSPWYLNYFFILFNPDTLFLIYIFITKNSLLKKTNIIIFLISTISRGWMGGVLPIITYFFCTSKINIRIIFPIIIVFLLNLPFLFNAKWFFREHNISDISLDLIVNLFDFSTGYFQALFDTFNYIINRLQHITIISYIYDLSDSIYPLKNNFLSVYSEGLPQRLFHTMLGTDYILLNQYIVQNFIADNNANWNVQVGLSSWFIISPLQSIFLIIYFSALLIIAHSIPILKKIYNYHLLVLYLAIFTLLVGWVSTFINVIIYGLISAIIIKLFNLKTSIFNEDKDEK
ncbi:oligosaccharide repeat unit polymerase [Proteus mirabilis]|uniref:oligosaccharide repeat unit polymerase n=1 Tax=Proteus mirabilis TaxID=584 RepID=UPI0034D3FCD5